ncbi:TraR/DksA family transcriptional regulator [Citrobacter portucalensis]|uniref:TraR/DksA family transcriptional regulator n=1 Tax=Citrobacter portucalensis TaxID=1639133 RepID=A0ABZ0H6Y7_9ENTR|nr:TraR/DksA family transcriptional regulator [Citrobacter portucalensis]MDE9663550.1 TraR/DksA family transcriptional regulator [Citrobacter portucalensis]MDE9672646.1 TraR/DksA family transcriptional regulator [Citrobacter portucalensis]MEB2744540.1 TraR/DksA family transcriptional regulator [Citrobacter portucalensis]WOH45281.1 TraR/DksA family transcriptional regulator [Citrobacter portucalensis]WOH45634.1 TraR/DksA family transcriptional regulator [Citrobacter portucalensis]
MADIIDNASTLEDLQRDAALSMHRLNHSAVSATHCEECGDKLLDARRKAYPGCTMCVDCQSNMELRKKIGRM